MKTTESIDAIDFNINLSFNAEKYIVDSKPLTENEFQTSLKPDNTSIPIDLINKDIEFNQKKYI